MPPGVDEAAYVKAAFLTAIAKGEATSPLVTPVRAVELLGTMQATTPAAGSKGRGEERGLPGS